MSRTSPFSEILDRFSEQQVVTVATGATCAYLGDERNLREFLVADEVVRALRRNGHTVHFYLFDDCLDPLNDRQLRVGVRKDEALEARFRPDCGKPIAHLPDPYGCHASYSDHFEAELLERLHRLDCHPNLIPTAKLYERGVYAPYVRQVLECHDEILAFLSARFAGYRPEKLFWVLCPGCGYMDETRITRVEAGAVHAHCARCERAAVLPPGEVRGKLSWKLDCAARWTHFRVDLEPFNKSYLEPQAGTFAVAQALGREFFGGRPVTPLPYGLVKMDKRFGYTLLESLPAGALRGLLTERPAADLNLTRDLVVTTASRHEVLPGLSYLEFVRQLLPMWLTRPDALTPGQRDLVAGGIAFARHFLHTEIRLHLPTRAHFVGEEPAVLEAIGTLLRQVIRLREVAGLTADEFQDLAKGHIENLAHHKKAALRRLRFIVGQQEGLPVTRFLFLLPLEYLHMLEYLLDLQLGRPDTAASYQKLFLAA